MKKMVLALAATMTTLSFATVDPLPKKDSESAIETEVKTLKKEIIDTSSRGFRNGKNFVVTSSPIGLEYGTTSRTIEFGKFVSGDGVVSLRYSDLQSNPEYWSFYNEAEEDIAEENDKGYALSLGYKQFLSNTFYIKPEIYYRNQKKVYDVDSDYDYDTGTYTITNVEGGDMKDIGFSFRFGNQWQWRNFTMGCDWFGFANTTSIIENEDIESQEQINLSLLNFYLGASF